MNSVFFRRVPLRRAVTKKCGTACPHAASWEGEVLDASGARADSGMRQSSGIFSFRSYRTSDRFSGPPASPP